VPVVDEKPVQVTITRPAPGGGTPSSRRALLVGINEFPTASWKLRGCVNDMLDMNDILKKFYGFKEDEIHLVQDRDATGKRLRDEFSWLLSGYNGGDVRFFSFSSHGTQVDDQSGDEWECKDEVIVPYDHSWANPFRDDDLKVIFDQIPADVNFTFLADCCHSGTIQKDVLDQVEDFRPRFISPPVEIQDRILAKQEARDTAADAYISQELMTLLKDVPQDRWAEMIPKLMEMLRNRFRENKFGTVSTDRHILLAGCEDKQTSADARIEGAYRGAFTWAIGKTIRERNGILSYEDLIRTAAGKMKNFTQKPQLECPTTLKNLQLFSALK
jgi:metacaspase-1